MNVRAFSTDGGDEESPLSNTQTLQNLKDAFAGESMANRRYTFFAQRADVEGYPDVASVFRSTAEGTPPPPIFPPPQARLATRWATSSSSPPCTTP
jgi:hypothetical protein